MTSATITVTLSGPPLRRASSISRSAVASGSGSLSASARVSSLTTPESPSEQSMYRSPARASRIERSGSTSWPLSARSSSERCGWLLASSGVMRPSSISVWTNVSSWVICDMTPSRTR